MAWVSRTSRKQQPLGAGAPSTHGIGPGSYNTETKSKLRPCYAAFGSSGLKDGNAQVDIVTPGPGTYESPQGHPACTIPADLKSSVFKSKSDRIQSENPKYATPGPGSYTSTYSSFSNQKKIKQ